MISKGFTSALISLASPEEHRLIISAYSSASQPKGLSP